MLTVVSNALATTDDFFHRPPSGEMREGQMARQKVMKRMEWKVLKRNNRGRRKRSNHSDCCEAVQGEML